MWVAPKINGSQFTANLMPGCVSPANETMPLVLPLTFANVCNLDIFRGNYTPNNDYRYIFQSLPLALAPNFIIIIVDAQMNISMDWSTGAQHVVPLSRFFFSSWIMDPLNFMNSLYIEGRTNAASPMPQGTAVNYNIIIGQANIT